MYRILCWYPEMELLAGRRTGIGYCADVPEMYLFRIKVEAAESR
jgi:hypothetical protein